MPYRLLPVFFLLWSSFVLPAQSLAPFNLRTDRELILLGSGGAGAGLSFLLTNRTQAFTPAQVTGLNSTNVPRFDRWSIGQYSQSARKGSDMMVLGVAIVPGLCLMLDPAIRKSPWKPALVMSEVAIVSNGVTMLTKKLAHRTRPFVYDPNVPLAPKLEQEARRSFFSGHTSLSASLSFGYASIWSAYHPTSRWKPLVWTGAALLPAATGYMRIRAGKHFLSDVIVGYACGAACGWLIPKLHL